MGVGSRVTGPDTQKLSPSSLVCSKWLKYGLYPLHSIWTLSLLRIPDQLYLDFSFSISLGEGGGAGCVLEGCLGALVSKSYMRS